MVPAANHLPSDRRGQTLRMRVLAEIGHSQIQNRPLLAALEFGNHANQLVYQRSYNIDSAAVCHDNDGDQFDYSK
jgi:hypothetical protein